MLLLKRLRCIFLCIVSGVAFQACNLAPIFDSPRGRPYDDFKYQAYVDSLASVPLDTVWWQYFNDPTLNEIIQQVSNNNRDLRAALRNVEQVSALARIDRSYLLPEVGIDANASRRVISQNSAQRFETNKFTNYTLLGLASYQIDLWGQLRNNYRAARIEAEIAQLEYYNLLSALRAQAASAYMNIRQLDAQIALYDSTVVLRERSLEIASLNFEAGATDALDQARAETQLRIAQSERWTLINERARFENAIAVLTGQEPANFSVPPNQLDSLPPVIPTQVPSEVLTQRPDVWIALKTMEAENARIGVAKAAFYPNITLSAEAGFQGRSFENLLSPQSFSWTMASGLLQPVFNYGRNHAALDAAYARYEQVADLYQQTVLSAFEEVENELADIYYLRQQYQRQQQTVAAANRTLSLARQRYEAGLVSYLEVVDAERTALLNQVDAVVTIGNLYQSTVELSLALGGSWNVHP